MAFRCDLGIAVRAHSQDDLSLVRRSARAASINTSLSTTVSFSFCWCNRNAVHVDSRCARFRSSHLIGGQHGEEGKESEEDGEEGSEEEEVKEEVRSRRRQLPTSLSATSQDPWLN